MFDKQTLLDLMPDYKKAEIENFNPAIYIMGMKYDDKEWILREAGASEFEVSKFMGMVRQFDQKRKLLGQTLDGYKKTIDVLKDENFKMRTIISNKYPDIKMPYFYAAKSYPITPPSLDLENGFREQVKSENHLTEALKSFMLECINFMVTETRRRNNMICKLESHIKSLENEKVDLAEIIIRGEINAASADMPKVPERNTGKTILYNNPRRDEEDHSKISV